MGEFEYFLEVLLYVFSFIIAVKLIILWYSRISVTFNPRVGKLIKFLLSVLPFIWFIILLYTIMLHASYDVVTDPYYICFYILLGYAWIYYGIKLLFVFFDLSLRDDVLHNGNKAALFPVTGGIIGITLIYSGANIGDGPGFWCVFVAGGIGLIIWFLLILILNLFTRVLDRILISRDIGSGLRLGGYMISSGILLARASGGDWFSFNQTIIDFADCWILLPITFIYLIIELIYRYLFEKISIRPRIFSSLIISIFLIALAILALIYIIPPFKENPLYGNWY